jgi:hypothetical protein
VSQAIFLVASISLVEHRYALRSKGKPILDDSDQLWDKEKPIPDNVKRLPRKTEPELGRTESKLGKTESSSNKEKPVLGNAN